MSLHREIPLAYSHGDRFVPGGDLMFEGAVKAGGLRFAAPKHGRAGLIRPAANEWAARGLNAIAPDYIETNMTETLRPDHARSTAIPARIPAGPGRCPEDIAGAGADISGAILNLDGGRLAR